MDVSTLSSSATLSSSTLGQNHSIKGQIVDAKSNEPLIGVNITVEGTSNGTISDIDGRFTLSVAANAVLKISYIDYQEKKIKVDDLKKSLSFLWKKTANN